MLFFLCCLGNRAQDLAQYVNEVKRDIETLREIDQYQKSIENLVSPPSPVPRGDVLGSICLFFFCRTRLSVSTGDPKVTGGCGWPRWTNEPNRTGEASGRRGRIRGAFPLQEPDPLTGTPTVAPAPG